MVKPDRKREAKVQETRKRGIKHRQEAGGVHVPIAVNRESEDTHLSIGDAAAAECAQAELDHGAVEQDLRADVCVLDRFLRGGGGGGGGRFNRQMGKVGGGD